jgi:dienelactone hydrolase
MEKKHASLGILLIVPVIAASIGLQTSRNDKADWSVTEEGILQYSLSTPEYQLTPIETSNSNRSMLYDIEFISRDKQMAGLLRVPGSKQDQGLPGVVLLPGATVTKEREQVLAEYLGNLGYASITFDQRNLGSFDMKADMQMFLAGIEPQQHKMIYDALAAAEILRSLPGIDPERIMYMGESNGARFAIIACALDARSRGVVAISTSGYGIDDAIALGRLKDGSEIEFLRSIDPETYLDKISPRRFIMIHSKNDPVIPYDDAFRTYIKAIQPKDMYAVECNSHGYCAEMNRYLERELMSIGAR